MMQFSVITLDSGFPEWKFLLWQLLFSDTPPYQPLPMELLGTRPEICVYSTSEPNASAATETTENPFQTRLGPQDPLQGCD